MTEDFEYNSEETYELVLRAQKGCEDSKNKLTKAYDRIVWYLLKKYNVTKDREEAFQWGMVGLTKAIIYYDIKYGTEFKTFVQTKAEGELLMYFRGNNTLYIPRKVSENYQKIKKTVQQHIKEFGCEPRDEDVMREKGLSREEYDLAVKAKDMCLSLSTPISVRNQGRAVSILDTISERTDPYHSFELSDMLKKLSSEVLTETERMIIHLRYDKQMTQAAIAEEKGMNQGFISRTEKRALAKLRENIDKQAI